MAKSSNIHTKPSVLYHGSCAGVEGTFQPRPNTGDANGQFTKGPQDLVFASDDRQMSLLYSLKTKDMISVVSGNGQNVGLFTNHERWKKETEKAPCTLYSLPSDTFTNTISSFTGSPTQEWKSSSEVTPSSSERITPQKAMGEGVQLAFLDAAIDRPMWDDFLANAGPKLKAMQEDGFFGTHLLRELQDKGLVTHLNQKENIHPFPLPKHPQGNKLKSEISDLAKAVAYSKAKTIGTQLNDTSTSPSTPPTSDTRSTPTPNSKGRCM
ncbi:MAG: hypothetical protein MK052_04030 [Alphaproteobacteria bacterium]|nr:hypothetical protein [Alphaproteobacteria bacterium]